jgi:hypothetical protein
VLAVPADCDELGALEAGGKCLDGEPAEDTCIAHRDVIDRLAQGILCEYAFEAFDVRQFGHIRVRPSGLTAREARPGVLSPKADRMAAYLAAGSRRLRIRPASARANTRLLRL